MTCAGEIDRALVLVLSAALKFVVLVVVAASELTLVLHCRFLDRQTLLYATSATRNSSSRRSSISATSYISSSFSEIS